MTFYNVISGILFIGTCQAFVLHFGTSKAWYASLLMVVMFYESVITSHLLEGQDPPVKTYSLKMKVLDLLAFIFLAYALIAVSPDSNQFGSGAAIPGAGSPSLFLILLAAYGLVAIYWNYAAGRSFEQYSLVPPIVLLGAAGPLRAIPRDRVRHRGHDECTASVDRYTTIGRNRERNHSSSIQSPLFKLAGI